MGRSRCVVIPDILRIILLPLLLMGSMGAHAVPALDRSTVSPSGGSSAFGTFSINVSSIEPASGDSSGGGFRIMAGYVHTLNRGDRDSDTITDSGDNCPLQGNTGQEDLDEDSLGDICDPDVDGDLVLNGDDPDDDNDGMDDSFELANNLNPYNPADAGLDPDLDNLTSLAEFTINSSLDPNDPDTDGDDIDDGLDPNPVTSYNECVDADATFLLIVYAGEDRVCGAESSITLDVPAEVQTAGTLLLISPNVIFKPGFKIGGQMTVQSLHPCAACDP